MLDEPATGADFFSARFLISKRAFMSGKPTWGDGR